MRSLLLLPVLLSLTCVGCGNKECELAKSSLQPGVLRFVAARVVVEELGSSLDPFLEVKIKNIGPEEINLTEFARDERIDPDLIQWRRENTLPVGPHWLGLEFRTSATEPWTYAGSHRWGSAGGRSSLLNSDPASNVIRPCETKTFFADLTNAGGVAWQAYILAPFEGRIDEIAVEPWGEEQVAREVPPCERLSPPKPAGGPRAIEVVVMDPNGMHIVVNDDLHRSNGFNRPLRVSQDGISEVNIGDSSAPKWIPYEATDESFVAGWDVAFDVWPLKNDGSLDHKAGPVVLVEQLRHDGGHVGGYRHITQELPAGQYRVIAVTTLQLEMERKIDDKVFLFNRENPRAFYDSALFFGQFPGMTGEDDYGPFEILNLRPIEKKEEEDDEEDSKDLEYPCGAYIKKRYTYNAISYVDTLVGHGSERRDRALIILPSDPYQAAESWKKNASGDEGQRIDDWWIKAGGGLALSLTKDAISDKFGVSSISSAFIRYPVSGLIAIMPDPTVVYDGEFWIKILGEIAFKGTARLGGCKLAGAHAGIALAVAKFVADVVVHVVQNDVVHSVARSDDLVLSSQYDSTTGELHVEVINFGPPIRDLHICRLGSASPPHTSRVVPRLPTNQKTTLRFSAAVLERGLELVYTVIPYPGQAYEYTRNLDDLDMSPHKLEKKQIRRSLVLEEVRLREAGLAGPFNNTPSYQVVATVRNTSRRPVELYLRSRGGEDHSVGWGDDEPELFADERPRLYAIGVEGRDCDDGVFRPIPSIYAWKPYTKTPSQEAPPNVCEIAPKDTRSFSVTMSERFTPELIRVFLRDPEEFRYDEVTAVGLLDD